MRHIRTTQNSIFGFRPEHEITRYLERIDGWLDRLPEILDWLSLDLRGGGTLARLGMTCEEVI